MGQNVRNQDNGRKADGPLTVAIIQPAYAPWLGYFDQMVKAHIFVHYDDVQLSRKSWHSRNRIKTPAGEDWLSVPVAHTGGRPTLIRDALIAPGVDWARRQLGQIHHAYRQAPFFDVYYPMLEDILLQPWERILDLNLFLAHRIMDALNGARPARRIAARIQASSMDIPADLDTTARPLRICQAVGAKRFLCGPTAKDYINVGAFEDAGIEVAWHEYPAPQYQQLHGDWIPRLSAIDALMNCGAAAADLIGRVDAAHKGA